jgi:hypothetical protein
MVQEGVKTGNAATQRSPKQDGFHSLKELAHFMFKLNGGFSPRTIHRFK